MAILRVTDTSGFTMHNVFNGGGQQAVPSTNQSRGLSASGGEEATVRLSGVASVGGCSVRGHWRKEGVGCEFQILCLHWEPVTTHPFMGAREKVLRTAGELAYRRQIGGSYRSSTPRFLLEISVP